MRGHRLIGVADFSRLQAIEALRNCPMAIELEMILPATRA